MTVFKCKMCGGSLIVEEGQSVCTCEYCDTVQTLPRIDDERLVELYNRANYFRQKLAFDKAAQIYENIVNEKPQDAEAHWALVLCRYGIEYVEDPDTFERIPTCHRASFDPILDDIDYKDALKYADSVAMDVYKKEAAYIDGVLKKIIEISGKEEPYDIFICFKETDDKGDRTLDSVKAQEIYDALTDKGYKVFFSRITLEGMLGVDYEPHIFAALNSAKIMLVVTTEQRYVNSVWVKNEWSRYLKIMANSKGRYLIPCYLNMDPYDLPDEFQKMQGQDMSKLGYLQDLLRGIGKILPGQTAGFSNGPGINISNIQGLVKLILLALSQEDYDKAEDVCDKLMIASGESSIFYLLKLYIGYILEDDIEIYVDNLRRKYPEMLPEEKIVFDSNNYIYFFEIMLSYGFLSRAEYILKAFPGVVESDFNTEDDGEFISVMNHAAIIQDYNPDMIKNLLRIGLDPNKFFRVSEENESFSVLYDALMNPPEEEEDRQEIIRLLMDSAAAPVPGDDYEMEVCFNCAIINNDYELVKYLLDKGADPDTLCYDWGEEECSVPAVYYAACRSLSSGIVQLLLERGANMLPSDEYGSPILNFFKNTDYPEGAEEVLRILLEHGADPDIYEEWTDDKGQQISISVLCNALINCRRPELIKILIGYGANVNSVNAIACGDDTFRTRPQLLSAIIDSKDPEIVRLLLENGADPNASEQWTDDSGRQLTNSALYTAINFLEAPEVVKLLLEHGANADSVNTVSCNDNSLRTRPVLITAVYSKNPEIVRILLESGANANACDRWVDDQGRQRTNYALYTAIISSKSPEMVSLLLEYGAAPDMVTDVVIYNILRSRNALIAAIIKTKDPEIVRLLLTHGANANACEKYIDDKGQRISKSALYHAIVNCKSPEIVKLLLEHGADPNEMIELNWDVTLFNRQKAELNKKYSLLSLAILVPQSREIVTLLVQYGVSWKKHIDLSSKVSKLFGIAEEVYPYSIFGVPQDFLAFLRTVGWKGK